MKLALIHLPAGRRLTEGFALAQTSAGITDNEIISAVQNKNDFKKLANLHDIVYSDTDTDADFIRIEPANQQRRLPSVKPDRQALSTFQGASIIYGFAFVETNDLKDHVAERLRAFQNVRHYDRLLSDYNEMVKANNNRDNNVLRHYWGRSQKPKVHPITRQPYNLPPDPVKAKEYLANIRQEIDAMPDTDEVINKETINKYKEALKFTFAQLIKHQPQHQIVQQFIELAARNFVAKTSKEYTHVLYPQSKSDFNKLFSKRIANDLGISPSNVIPAFEKIPWDQVEMNREEMEKHYGDQADVYHNRLRKAYGTLIAKHRKNDTELQIKGITWKGLRRYIQLWKLAAGVDLQGSDVLIIDDNVDSSGTIENLHKLVTAANPQSVDVYTPLHLTAKPAAVPTPERQLAGVG